MTFKTISNVVFAIHRYLGLVIGLIVIIIGLTGSLLVFHTEINDFQRHYQIGTIVPQGEPLPVEAILNIVKPIYANQPDAVLQALYLSPKPDEPANVVYATKANDWIENFVNPYTGALLGNTLNPNPVEHFFKIVYRTYLRSLHIGCKPLQH